MQFNRLGRRDLLGGATAVWPLAASAQQAGKARRIGFIPTASTSAWLGSASTTDLADRRIAATHQFDRCRT
jgi:hypothetical protein